MHVLGRYYLDFPEFVDNSSRRTSGKNKATSSLDNSRTMGFEYTLFIGAPQVQIGLAFSGMLAGDFSASNLQFGF